MDDLEEMSVAYSTFLRNTVIEHTNVNNKAEAQPSHYGKTNTHRTAEQQGMHTFESTGALHEREQSVPQKPSKS